MVLNQIQENVYCNSDTYDRIYDKSILETNIAPLSVWADTTLIQPNIAFFSKLLKVNVSQHHNQIPLQNQYDESGEQNRRGLDVTVDNRPHFNLVISQIVYRYKFNFHSPGKRYTQGMTETINNTLCKCIRVLNNHVYVFRTCYQNLFHFTFHPPTPTLPKEHKIKGAFHLKMDSFAAVPPHVVPYRPFLVDPRKPTLGSRTHFLPWNAFPSTDGYFTTTVVPGMLEISSFLQENPAVTVVYTVRGQTVHYLEDIVRPIYDKIVTDVLDPLAAGLRTHDVPAAVKYDPAHPTIPCHHKGTSLRTLKKRPKHERTLRQQGRELWMGGRHRHKRWSKNRARTHKNRRGVILYFPWAGGLSRSKRWDGARACTWFAPFSPSWTS